MVGVHFYWTTQANSTWAHWPKSSILCVAFCVCLLCVSVVYVSAVCVCCVCLLYQVVSCTPETLNPKTSGPVDP